MTALDVLDLDWGFYYLWPLISVDVTISNDASVHYDRPGSIEIYGGGYGLLVFSSLMQRKMIF